MRNLDITFILFKQFSEGCEIHRFFMDCIDFLVFNNTKTLKNLAVLFDCSLDTVKSWSCGRKLPSNKYALLIISTVYKEYTNELKFKLWCRKRKNHFNFN